MIKKILLINIFLISTAAAAPFLTTFPLINQKTACHIRNKNVEIFAQFFTRSDSKNYFGIDLYKHGIQPIFITIKNELDFPLMLRPETLSLPLISDDYINSTLTFDVKLFLLLTLLPSFVYSPVFTPAISIAPSLLLWRFNTIIIKNLNQKKLDPHHILTIAAQQHVKKIIFFAASSFLSRFELILFNEEHEFVTTVTIDLLQAQRSLNKPYLPFLTTI